MSYLFSAITSFLALISGTGETARRVLFWLLGGAVTPNSVLSSHLIRQVYDVESEVQIHPHTGKLQIYFFPTQS
jgi:hypothetical protein